jgi:hypothetical protein
MDFNQLVAKIAPEYEHTPESRICPDQYVGLLSKVIGQPSFPFRALATSKSRPSCLLLILESPHLDEFIGDPGPSKGFTGKMIRQHLQTTVGISDPTSMGLVLINAIQYQCSLGDINLYRDKIFRAAWDSGGQENFIQRLLATYRAGDILMNCCTRGNDSNTHIPLRNLVESAIQTALPGLQSMKRTHPSSWRHPENRGREWLK